MPCRAGCTDPATTSQIPSSCDLSNQNRVARELAPTHTPVATKNRFVKRSPNVDLVPAGASKRRLLTDISREIIWPTTQLAFQSRVTTRSFRPETESCWSPIIWRCLAFRSNRYRFIRQSLLESQDGNIDPTRKRVHFLSHILPECTRLRVGLVRGTPCRSISPST